MAKLWEDTVVLAMRDEKWRHALRHFPNGVPLPRPFLKLDGNAEKRLGDVIDVANDRFFLFEVKGTRFDASAEWESNNQKSAFQVLQAEVSGYLNGFGSNIHLVDSLRAHFFCYWAEYVRPPRKAWANGSSGPENHIFGFPDCLTIEPYLKVCMDAGTIPGRSNFESFSLGLVDEFHIRKRPRIPLSAVYEDVSCLLMLTHEQPPSVSTTEPLGLQLEAFTRYITDLCSLAGDAFEEIHAVVMSQSGQFFRVVRSTLELREVFYPHLSAKKRGTIDREETLFSVESGEAIEFGVNGATPKRFSPR